MSNTNATKPSWLKPGASYHSNAATIAAQLHEIADALAALGDHPLSEMSLSVSIQASQHRPHRDRVATVDLLAKALEMSTRVQVCGNGDVHYGPSYDQVFAVNAFACVVSAAEYEAGRLIANETHVGLFSAECACGVMSHGDTQEEAQAALHRHIDSHPVGAAS